MKLIRLLERKGQEDILEMVLENLTNIKMNEKAKCKTYNST